MSSQKSITPFQVHVPEVNLVLWSQKEASRRPGLSLLPRRNLRWWEIYLLLSYCDCGSKAKNMDDVVLNRLLCVLETGTGVDDEEVSRETKRWHHLRR